MTKPLDLGTGRSGEAAPSGLLIEEIAEHVTQIRLDRVERLNALGMDMVQALTGAITGLRGTGTRVLLIRGTGRSFCAGADLKERRGMGLPERIQHNAAINTAIAAVAEAPMVTIGVINGLALGGGCELALACDLRIAGEGAVIGLTESRVGAIPGAGGTQRLPRLVGVSRALQLILTGEPVSAARAEAIGLVNEVVAPADLDRRARELAMLLAARSPTGLRTAKRLVMEGMELPLANALAREREALVEILDSADYAEGLAAFAEKRAPRFGESLESS